MLSALHFYYPIDFIINDYLQKLEVEMLISISFLFVILCKGMGGFLCFFLSIVSFLPLFFGSLFAKHICFGW